MPQSRQAPVQEKATASRSHGPPRHGILTEWRCLSAGDVAQFGKQSDRPSGMEKVSQFVLAAIFDAATSGFLSALLPRDSNTYHF